MYYNFIKFTVIWGGGARFTQILVHALKWRLKLAASVLFFYNSLKNEYIFHSTTENLAVFIWNELQKHLPANLLFEVKIHETEKNVVYYRGDFQWCLFFTSCHYCFNHSTYYVWICTCVLTDTSAFILFSTCVCISNMFQ